MVRMTRILREPRKRRGIRVPNWMFKRGAKFLLHPVVKPFVARALGTYGDFKRTEAIAARQRGSRESAKIANQKQIEEFYRQRKRKQPQKAVRLPKAPAIQKESVIPKSYGDKITTPLSGAGTKRKSVSAIGSYGGRFKKRRAYKRVRKPTQGNQDSVFGTIHAQEAAYFGWSTSGGRDYAIKQLAEQIVKQVCAERKIDIRGRTEPLPWNYNSNTHVKTLRLMFRHVHGDGTLTDSDYDVALTTTSTGNVAVSFDEATSNTVVGLKEKLAYVNQYLYGYQLLNEGAEPPSVVRLQVDTWKVFFNVKVSCKIQNITPADDFTGGTDDNAQHYSKDSIMSNPLKGRSYEFSPGYPRVRPAVAASNSDLHKMSAENGDHGFLKFPDQSNAIYNPGNLLHSPPPGGTIFQNCIKGASMYINPGNFKVLTSSFRFNGTVKQLCLKLASNQAQSGSSQYTRYTLGNTVAFGLVPTMRTTTSENVKIAYQYDVASTCSLWPRYKCTIPRSNNSSLLNFPTTGTT